MPDSVLDAIKMGIWDFEPQDMDGGQFEETKAMPGTIEKLDILAARVRKGMPLWHPSDRVSYDEA